MATATWFDYNAYMANKLVQVNAIDPKVQCTPETLKAEFEKAGYVGEEGAFKHFEQYGKTEDVAPNALFDADEYITAKAADFFTTDKPTASQIAEVAKAFADGGMSAWDHYVTYGSSEGVEPSFSFNTDAYLTAKAAALNAGKYDGKENWTAEDVAAAIKASGSTVLEHFMANGGGGELEVAVSYKGITEGGAKNPFIDPTPPTPVPAPNPGAEYTLKADGNTFTPTSDPATSAKDDVVKGDWANFKAEDKLEDSNNTDNDVIAINAAAKVSVTKGQVSGFENLKVNWQGVGVADVDAKNFTGLKNIEVASEKLGYYGEVTVTNAGKANVTNANSESGALIVKGITDSTVAAGKASTVTVNAYGENTAAEKVTLTMGDSATAVTVGDEVAFGEANVTLGAKAKTVAVNAGKSVVDASKVAKDATITVNGTADDTDSAQITVGNDITVALTSFNDKETFGLKIADGKTVTLNSTTAVEKFAVDTAGDATIKVNAANINKDILTKTGTGKVTVELATAGTADLSKVQADEFKLAAGAGNYTLSSGANLNIGAGLGAVTVAYKVDAKADTTNDVLNAIYTSATSDSTQTLNNFNTFNITSNVENTSSGTAIDVELGTVTMTDGVSTTLSLTAAKSNNLAFTAVTAGVIDATNAKGDVTVTTWNGSNNAFRYVGATGKNDITLAGGAKSANITTFDGEDTIELFTVTADFSGTVNTGDGVDKVFMTIANNSTGTVNINTGAEDDKITLTTAAATATTGTYNFDFGGGVGNKLAFDITTTNTLDLSEATLNLTGLKVIDADASSSGVTLAKSHLVFAGHDLSGKAIKFMGKGGDDIVTVEAVDGTAQKGEVINLAGHTNAGSDTDDTIDGFHVIGSAGADTITASAIGGTIAGGGGADIINAGTGVDNIDFDGVTYGANKVIATLNGMASADTITFTTQGTNAFTSTAVNVTSATSLSAALDEAVKGDGSSDGAIKWFQYADNTYIVQDVSSDATMQAGDLAIKLTGIVDLSSATFTSDVLTLA